MQVYTVLWPQRLNVHAEQKHKKVVNKTTGHNSWKVICIAETPNIDITAYCEYRQSVEQQKCSTGIKSASQHKENSLFIV